MLDKFANAESGLSIRNKLNDVIDALTREEGLAGNGPTFNFAGITASFKSVTITSAIGAATLEKITNLATQARILIIAGAGTTLTINDKLKAGTVAGANIKLGGETVVLQPGGVLELHQRIAGGDYYQIPSDSYNS